MEKTIKEWLETLPEPYRTEALDETKPRDSRQVSESLVKAICDAFSWSQSEQGSGYWNEVAERAEAGEFNNLLLDKDSEKL